MNQLKTILSGLLLTSTAMCAEAQYNPLTTGGILHQDDHLQLLAAGRGGTSRSSSNTTSSSSSTRGTSSSSTTTKSSGSDSRGGSSKSTRSTASGSDSRASKSSSSSSSSNSSNTRRGSNNVRINEVKKETLGHSDAQPAPPMDRPEDIHYGAVPPPPPPGEGLPPTDEGIVYGSTYATTSSNDTSAYEPNHIARNHMYVMLGANMTNRHGFWNDEQTSGPDTRFGYMLGLRYELGISNSWYISVGAGYSKQNYEDEYDDNNYMKSTKTLVDVPMFIGYRGGNDDDFTLGLGVGPTFGFGLGGKTKVHWDERTEEFPETMIYGSKGSYEFNSFGGSKGHCKVMAGVGFEINITYKRFLIGYSYQSYFGHDYEPAEYETYYLDTNDGTLEIPGFVNDYHFIQNHCIKIGCRIF